MEALVHSIVEKIHLPDGFSDYVALSKQGVSLGIHLDTVSSLTDDDMETWVNALVTSYQNDPHRTHLLAMTFFHHLFTPERSEALHRRYWPAIEESMTPFTRIMAAGNPVLMALLNEVLTRTNTYHLSSWEQRYGAAFLEEALTLPLHSDITDETFMTMAGHMTAHIRMMIPAYRMRPALTVAHMAQQEESDVFMKALMEHPAMRDAHQQYGNQLQLPDGMVVDIDDDARDTFMLAQFRALLPIAMALKPTEANETAWMEQYAFHLKDCIQDITVPFFMDFTLDMQAQFLVVWWLHILNKPFSVLMDTLNTLKVSSNLVNAVQRCYQGMNHDPV